jgi:hypothetical protein
VASGEIVAAHSVLLLGVADDWLDGGADSLCQRIEQPADRQGHPGQRGIAGQYLLRGGIWQNIERGMPDLYKTAMSLNPTGRMGTPQEVAAGVVFLASPVASRISGTFSMVRLPRPSSKSAGRQVRTTARFRRRHGEPCERVPKQLGGIRSPADRLTAGVSSPATRNRAPPARPI